MPGPQGTLAHNILVQYGVEAVGLPSAARVRKWARAALIQAERPSGCVLTVRLVGESEGRALNAQYRGRSAATNVLSFGYEDPPPRRGALGDIVLCVPVIQGEAEAQGLPSEAHWAHLVVHGIMHLCGHDHEQPEEAAAMEALEVRVLQDLGYDNPY